MTQTGSIYVLKDPRDGAPRYVGKTICPLRKRLIEHYSKPVTAKMRAWVDELNTMGLRPTIELLEEVPRDRLKAYEDYWMAEIAYQSAYLFNTIFGHATTAAYLGRQRPVRPV